MVEQRTLAKWWLEHPRVGLSGSINTGARTGSPSQANSIDFIRARVNICHRDYSNTETKLVLEWFNYFKAPSPTSIIKSRHSKLQQIFSRESIIYHSLSTIFHRNFRLLLIKFNSNSTHTATRTLINPRIGAPNLPTFSPRLTFSIIELHTLKSK